MARPKLSSLATLAPQGALQTRTLLTTSLSTAHSVDGTAMSFSCPVPSATDLSTTISAAFNTPYLSRAPMQVSRPRRLNGILYGPHLKPIISMVASHGLNAIHVHFLVESSSPTTFISREAITALLGREYLTPSEFPLLRLSGYVARAEQSRYWFPDLNLLGRDFLQEHRARVEVGYTARSVEVSFRGALSGPGG